MKYPKYIMKKAAMQIGQKRTENEVSQNAGQILPKRLKRMIFYGSMYKMFRFPVNPLFIIAGGIVTGWNSINRNLLNLWWTARY